MNEMIKFISLLLLLALFGCGNNANVSQEGTELATDTIPQVIGEYNNLDKDGILNLRIEPNVQSELLRSIPLGEKFVVLENNDDWSKIKTISNEIGYVKMNRVKILSNKTNLTNTPNQQSQILKNQSKDNVSSSIENYSDLIGGYAFERNGRVQIKIIYEAGSYYLQFPSSNSKEPMSEISEADCSRILGSNWKNVLISGLHSGAFFVFKVKAGSNIRGVNISSGYFGAIPAAGEMWKVK